MLAVGGRGRLLGDGVPAAARRRPVRRPVLQPARRGAVLRPRDDRHRGRPRRPARHRADAAATPAPGEVAVSTTADGAGRTTAPSPASRRAASPLDRRRPGPAARRAALVGRRPRPGAAAAGRLRRRLAPGRRGPRPRAGWRTSTTTSTRSARLMAERDWTTVRPRLAGRRRPSFDVRNPFPPGGVVEDPATGAAAAALGGYLRELGLVDLPATLTLRQGDDMGRPEPPRRPRARPSRAPASRSPAPPSRSPASRQPLSRAPAGPTLPRNRPSTTYGRRAGTSRGPCASQGADTPREVTAYRMKVQYVGMYVGQFAARCGPAAGRPGERVRRRSRGAVRRPASTRPSRAAAGRPTRRRSPPPRGTPTASSGTTRTRTARSARTPRCETAACRAPAARRCRHGRRRRRAGRSRPKNSTKNSAASEFS